MPEVEASGYAIHSSGQRERPKPKVAAPLGQRAVFAAVGLLCAFSLVARGQTPAAANSGDFVVGAQPQPAPAKPAAPAAAIKRLPDPSPARIQRIIHTFTANERLFRELLAHDYTYTESILMQELDDSGHPVGDYQQVNDINYSPDGNRQIVCTFCPQPTLRLISVTEKDITDMFNMNMYTLSLDELPQYNITYVDHQPLDQVSVYVFDVAPKKIEKHQRYFKGKVYVDDHDLMIVKSDGRVVPNEVDKHGNPTNTFLPFKVWRQKIDGKYWFPVYTLMQGTVPGSPGDAGTPMRMVIQFKDYKRFRSSARILSVQTLPSHSQPAPPAGAGQAPAQPKQ